jgi:AmmeMemoRadiSam system protein B
MKRANNNAGRFYPRMKKELISSIEQCFLDEDFGPGRLLELGGSIESRKTMGGICPHAGYIYSGAAAAFTYSKIFSENVPDTFIVIGNTHTGYRNIATMNEGVWETPLGDLTIKSSIAEEIIGSNKDIINDEGAFSGYIHGREHNIEVQMPFIKYGAMKAGKDISIVPIKVGQYKGTVIESVGKTIAEVIKNNEDLDVVVIASSDMFHESPKNPRNTKEEIESYKKRGEPVRDAIKTMNWNKTLNKAIEIGSICGPQTISTAMVASKYLGATHSEILTYYTSYEKVVKEGPTDYCVAYLSAVFKK